MSPSPAPPPGTTARGPAPLSEPRAGTVSPRRVPPVTGTSSLRCWHTQGGGRDRRDRQRGKGLRRTGTDRGGQRQGWVRRARTRRQQPLTHDPHLVRPSPPWSSPCPKLSSTSSAESHSPPRTSQLLLFLLLPPSQPLQSPGCPSPKLRLEFLNGPSVCG